MPSCLGRPSAGRLRSGEIAITYRLSVGLSTSLALYVETQETAKAEMEQSAVDLEAPPTVANPAALCRARQRSLRRRRQQLFRLGAVGGWRPVRR
jgi:hypothetical protein